MCRDPTNDCGILAADSLGEMTIVALQSAKLMGLVHLSACLIWASVLARVRFKTGKASMVYLATAFGWLAYVGLATLTAIRKEMRRQLEEIERRRKAYCGDFPPVSIKGRTVIVVDDGIATGGTMKAALRGANKNDRSWLVLAVPVAPPSTIAGLGHECDEVICLETYEPFGSVGAFYRDFTQTSDAEVISLLTEAHGFGFRMRGSVGEAMAISRRSFNTGPLLSLGHSRLWRKHTELAKREIRFDC
jgi:Phosphoribosyl transferase domain